MDLYDIKQLLRRTTYKPGWEFEAAQDVMRDMISVRIVARVPDANRPDQMVPVVSMGIFSAPMVRDAEDFKRWLGHQIRALEHHEIDEWYRFDGECVVDPHPEITKVKKKALSVQSPDLLGAIFGRTPHDNFDKADLL